MLSSRVGYFYCSIAIKLIGTAAVLLQTPNTNCVGEDASFAYAIDGGTIAVLAIFAVAYGVVVNTPAGTLTYTKCQAPEPVAVIVAVPQ
jgi:hypothetical protein